MNFSEHITGLASHIGEVKTPWTIAAFAIDALIALVAKFGAKPNSGMRKILWAIVGLVFLLAIVPVITDFILQSRQLNLTTIYRLRVTVVDAQNVPVDGALVRVTAASEAKTVSDGSAELAIPKGSLPQDGKIVIFADKNAAFQHGNKKLYLGTDHNPSIIIPVFVNQTAEVNGVVQDDAGHVTAGVRVSLIGGDTVTTDTDGKFRLNTHAAPGQKILLHAEKPGYFPESQYHPAGEPVVLVLTHQNSSPTHRDERHNGGGVGH